MSHLKEQKSIPLTIFSSSTSKESKNPPSPQASLLVENKEEKLPNTTYQKLSDIKKIAPASSSPPQVSVEEKYQDPYKKNPDKWGEEIALTSYSSPIPAPVSRTNLSFLQSFQKHCEAFEKLNLLNTGAQFTLQEKIVLEHAVDQLADLLHFHGFFPEYSADIVYSAKDLLSIIAANLPQLEVAEIAICSARMEELVKLIQGQIPTPSMLTKLIEHAESLTQAINTIEKPSESKSLQASDLSKQIIQAYGDLLAECRLNGFMHNDLFLYIDLSNDEQREAINKGLIDEILYQSQDNPLKYKNQINKTGELIGAALNRFAEFIKTVPAPVSIDSLSQDVASTSVAQYPLLQAVLKLHYLQQETVLLPCSDRRFPIQDCKLNLFHQDKSKTLLTKPSPDLEEKKIRGKRLEDVKEHQEIKDKKYQQSAAYLQTEPQSSEIEPGHKSSWRTLVVGSIGSGNTTFCQFSARQWVQQQDEQPSHALRAQQYDYLFVVSLPSLLADGKNHGNMQERVAAYIYKQLSTELQSQTSIQDIKMVLSQKQNSRTLLIFDGFDKVARVLADRHSPNYKLLHELLGFRHVIITTRSDEVPPAQYPFDSRRVNSELSKAEVGAYIQSYYKFSQEAKEKKRQDPSHDLQPAIMQAFALKTELERNDYFLELTQIPLFLAIICEHYLPAPVASSGTPHKTVDKDYKIAKTATADLAKLNLGQLHHDIVEQVLKRHMKDYQPVSLTSPREFYTPQLQIFGAIARHMYRSQKSIIEGAILLKEISTPNRQSPEDIQQLFAEILMLGFLQYHPDDEAKPLLERNYFFVTSGFEKYFAALHVLSILQGQSQKQAKIMSLWLGSNKYQPQHKALLDFCAGLSTQPGYDLALSNFWRALLSPPLDVVGKLHLRLIVNCLMASRFDHRIPARDKLLAEIRQWVDSMLLKDNFAKTGWLKDLLKDQPGVLRACGWQLSKAWVKAAKHEDENIQLQTVMALDRLGMNLASYPESLELLFNAARVGSNRISDAVKKAAAGLTVDFSAYPDSFAKIQVTDQPRGSDVRIAMCFALRASVAAGYLPAIDMVLKSLMKHVHDVDYTGVNEKGIMEALSVLGELRENLVTFPRAGDIMWHIANDPSFSAGIQIAALSNIRPLTAYPGAFAAALSFLNKNEPGVQVAAIQALTTSAATNEIVRETILKNAKTIFKVFDGEVFSAFAQLPDNLIYDEELLAVILGTASHYWSIPTLSEAVLQANARVGMNLHLHPKALQLICVLAVAEKPNFVAIDILGHVKLPTKVMGVFCQIGEDQKNIARTKVFWKLAEYIHKLTKSERERALNCLLRATKDEERMVRRKAISAFSAFGPDLISYPQFLDVVCQATVDKDVRVRVAAIGVLSELRNNPLDRAKPVFNIVFNALADKDPKIQKAMVTAVGKMGESLTSVQARTLFKYLKSRAKDPKDPTQEEALIALSAMKQDLAPHPDVLAQVLLHPLARDLLHTHTLVKMYLDLERQPKSFLSLSNPPNPCLPVLLARIDQEHLAITLDRNSLALLCLDSDQNSQFFSTYSIESAEALITAIQKMRKSCAQPSVAFASCVGDEKPYPLTAPVSTKTSLLVTTGKFKPPPQVQSALTTSTVLESKLINQMK